MTRFLVGRDDALAERQWTLVVTRGPDRGAQAALTHETELIGVAPAAALALRDDTVSRYHAEVDIFAHRVRVRDLKSTNGTADVQGNAHSTLWLESGDRFWVGETEISVRRDDRPFKPRPPSVDESRPAELVAESQAAIQFFRRLRTVAQSDGDLTIEGRPGSGCRSAARYLHEASPRRGQRLDVIPVPRLGVSAAIQRLLRSRGTTVLVGLAELSSSEAGHLASHLDAARSGPRFVAVTERTIALPFELQSRFGMLVVRVPALEERAEDMKPFVEHFSKKCPIGRPRVGPKTLAALSNRSWPRQIRELAEVVALFGSGRCARLSEDRRALASLYWSELIERVHGDVSLASRSVQLPTRQVFGILTELSISLE